MRKHYKVALASVLLSAGLVAGCGTTSNTSTSNSSGSGNSTGSGGSSSNTINIALASPFSGNESFIGPDTLNGVKVAIQEINANGGVLGKKLNVVTADTVGDPVDAVPAVQQIISTAHPAAMIGPSSLTITSVIKMLNQDKLVTMAIGGTTQLDNMQYQYIYRVTPSDSQMGVAMAYYGTKVKGYTKAAIVLGSNSSAQTLDAPIKNTLQKHGVNVVLDQQIVPDQSSYRSEVEKLIASKPQVIYTQLDPQTASTFYSELQQLGGGNIPLIGNDVTASTQFAQAIGLSYAQKELTSVQGASNTGQGSTLYNQYYAKVWQGAQPVILSNNGYDAMNIIALAMIEAKSTNPAKYVNYIDKVANDPGTQVYDFKSAVAAIQAGQQINYQGASGPEDFNQYHNVTGSFEADGFDAKGNLHKVADISASSMFGY